MLKTHSAVYFPNLVRLLLAGILYTVINKFIIFFSVLKNIILK
jgi:hypothetical protein